MGEMLTDGRVKRKPAAALPILVTSADIEDKVVPHFRDFVGQQPPELRIAIPSHGRPERLCTGTLALLRRHGIDMNAVYVFVSGDTTNAAGSPQWYEYLEAFRRHDFLRVHLQPGADGLEGQMNCIMTWAQRGYLILITDDILDVKERYGPVLQSSCSLRPLAAGLLEPVIAHAYALMVAGGFCAWSLNPSANAQHMSEDQISMKFGLLEGNLTGYLLADDATAYHVESGMGVVCDTFMSLNLWSQDRRYFRYRGLCLQHRYRAPGGYESVMSREDRRGLEDEAIQTLAFRHPKLIRFQEKPDASLGLQQCKFMNQGGPPLTMRPATADVGRRRVGFAVRAMTPAERQRKLRKGHRSLSASEGDHGVGGLSVTG